MCWGEGRREGEREEGGFGEEGSGACGGNKTTFSFLSVVVHPSDELVLLCAVPGCSLFSAPGRGYP